MKAAELTSLRTLKTLPGKAACSSLSGACHPRCHQVQTSEKYWAPPSGGDSGSWDDPAAGQPA